MMGVALNIQNHQQFRRAQIGDALFFQLVLKQGKDNLILRQCFRVLPGKRLVALAEWRGQVVIAKIFFHPTHSLRHAKREVTSLNYLQDALINAPKVLLHDSCLQDSVIQVVLLEQIAPAHSFFSVWLQTKAEKKTILMKSVLRLLADLHAERLLQNDLHPDNVLVSKGKLYMIDAGTITRCRRPIRRRVALDNVAFFLMQFPYMSDDVLCEQSQWYANYRQWQLSVSDWHYVLRRVRHWLRWRWRHHYKKLFKTCSYWCLMHRLGYTVVVMRDHLLAKHLDQVVAMAQSGYSRDFTVVSFSKSFRHHTAKMLWRRLEQFNVYGIPTPKSLAIIYPKKGYGTAVVITEKLKGMPLTAFKKGSAHPETVTAVHQQVALIKKRLSLLDLSIPEDAFFVHGETVTISPAALDVRQPLLSRILQFL